VLWWILGITVGLIAFAALGLLALDLVAKKRSREALAARGALLGTWTNEALRSVQA